MSYQILLNDTNPRGLSRLHLVSARPIDTDQLLLPPDASIFKFENHGYHAYCAWKEAESAPRRVSWLGWPRGNHD